jgi:hypothetical protein
VHDPKASRCGIYCGECGSHKKGKCAGCVPSAGKVFWGECDLAKCCTAKRLDHCGLCPDFPCAQLQAYSNDPKHGDGGKRIRNLSDWRVIGIEAWLKRRGEKAGPV